ncbi:MAG: MmcQ/YjbR family DNA-binding protein [Leadbetterella sp.]|nr:MmcQ/YjbR family DNA-binding protein [Leadbetterella sp.]
MNIEELREFCLGFKAITEETPFGPENLVYKVMGKMFALVPLDSEFPQVVVKNTPEKNEFLRNEYSYINTAYHFNKVHWVAIDNTLKNPALTRQLITESYEVVKKGLPKKLQAELE